MVEELPPSPRSSIVGLADQVECVHRNSCKATFQKTFRQKYDAHVCVSIQNGQDSAGLGLE